MCAFSHGGVLQTRSPCSFTSILKHIIIIIIIIIIIMITITTTTTTTHDSIDNHNHNKDKHDSRNNGNKHNSNSSNNSNNTTVITTPDELVAELAPQRRHVVERVAPERISFLCSVLKSYFVFCIILCVCLFYYQLLLVSLLFVGFLFFFLTH